MMSTESSLLVSSTWDFLEKFHADAGEGEVFRKIRAILEPHLLRPEDRHPFAYLLMSAPHPVELDHLEKRLQVLVKTAGSEWVVPRLGSPKDFATAWQEADC